MKTSAVVLALALAGCAALSDRREELLTDTQIAGLHRGASRAEVRELLGAPSSVETLPLEREVWTYKADRDGVWREDVLVQFSSEGVVREILLLNQAALRGGF
ncbi:MAG TPA: outer membrane protein assembly factor BamE [Burkholderiales bacterium]|nr:outer membrane protein assembly factor BamE [Burkholderiales bacterium]